MQVQCPGCNKTLSAPDPMAGRVVKCPSCGGQMQLPEAETAAEVQAQAPAPTRVAPAPPPSRRTTDPTGTKACQFCGEQVQTSAVKCRHCGEVLSAPRRRAQMASSQLLSSYKVGMRGLGVALILLGLLAILRGALGLAMLRQLWGETSPMGHETMVILTVVACFVLGVGAIYFLLGFFAFMMHNWVNWLVAVVSGLGVGLSVLGIVLGDLSVVTAVGFVAQLAFLATSVMNLGKRSRLRAAGVDPRTTGSRQTGAGRARVPARMTGARAHSRIRR